MNKLWVFGDSYSEKFSKLLKNRNWKHFYLDWKGYTPKSYGEIIAEKSNFILMNQAIGGTDNYTILDTIINAIDTINENDVIIIGWSNTLRFRVVSIENSFNTIRPGSLNTFLNYNKIGKYVDLSDETLTEIAVNRSSSVYINELNNYIKLLNFTFKNNKIIHWSPFAQHREGLNTTFKNPFDYETIREETKGEIDDGHFTSNAHELIATQLIDLIDNYYSLNPNVVKKSFI